MSVIADGSTGIDPPVAARVAHTITSPQGSRVDEYYWLRDDDAKGKRPEIIAYLNAENAYTEAATASLKPLEESILKELRGRIKEEDAAPPNYDRGYWYSTRFEAGAEYAIYERQKGDVTGRATGSAVEVLLNGPAMAAGKAFYSVGVMEVSPDNNWLAWTDDETGRRISTLRFKNLSTGAVSSESVSGVLEVAAWAADSKTVFYIKQDPVLLQTGPVYRHVVGTDPATDALVYNEPDLTLGTTVESSSGGDWIMISMEGFDTTELRAVSALTPTAEPVVVLARKANVRSYAEFLDGRWIIRTNEGARDFRLVEAPVGAADDRHKWTTIVPERPGVSLDEFALFHGAIAIAQRAEANATVRVMPWGAQPACKSTFDVKADESAFSMTLGTNLDPSTPSLRVQYTSMITPRQVLDVTLADGARKLVKEQAVIGYDRADYATDRLWAPARDGKRIPISIAWRKDRWKRGGTAPVFQEAYGAYGIPFDAEFSSNQVSLMDRGFLVATTHVRGGADLGQQWYEDGRLTCKVNTFNDFVDATDYLVREKYGAKGKVFAEGGSAGGLLMGAIANIAPEKYLGIALHVPFVDALTTMLDETIPLTTNEWTQWGDPREKAAYECILAYSPYDNIERQAYPAMLVTTGLWDSQVQYYEPAKYVAKLRAMRTDKNPLYLKVNMSAGHGGDSGRFERLKIVALEYAFFIDLAQAAPAAR